MRVNVTVNPVSSGLFSYAEMVRECDREIMLRRRLYPNRITTGRLSKDTAARQVALMEAIRAVLVELAKTERLL
jgi:hypothetical protein